MMLLQESISTLEILDTAVKVGIGALISGVSTYAVTRLQQKGEVEKERRARNAQTLQEVAEQVEKVNHVYLKYWALTTEAIKLRKSGKALSPERYKEREETKVELFHAFKELTNAEAKLMLIGEEKAFQLLRIFGESVAQFRKNFIVSENSVPEEEIDQLKENIFECRKLLFDELAIVYKKY